MVFDIAAKDAGVVVELSACGGEGIAEGDVDVLVVGLGFEVLFPFGGVAFCDGGVEGGLVVDDDLGAGDAEINVDVKAFAALVVLMGSFYHNVAARDAAVALLQGRDFFMDAGLDGG